MDRLARAGCSLDTLVIVSLAANFLGERPEIVAAMDSPAALLDSPGYDAWRGLRSRDESGWLFVAWNDFVLRTESEAAPVLWGEPGVIVAAQIAHSLARTGWPTEILGVDAAIGQFDLHEAHARGGRTVAIPLRAVMALEAARDLDRCGFLCLVCRADRDLIWLHEAPAVFDANARDTPEGRVLEAFHSLPFQFAAKMVRRFLEANARDLVAPNAPEQTAQAIALLLTDALSQTGPGAGATARPSEGDGGAGHFDIAIQFGRTVMDGFAFSIEVGL
jgi:predicted component of type VI protein secretion system